MFFLRLIQNWTVDKMQNWVRLEIGSISIHTINAVLAKFKNRVASCLVAFCSTFDFVM